MNVMRLCLALTAFLLTTGPSLADDILGTWLRDNGAMQVKFEPCGDAICGDIVWLRAGSPAHYLSDVERAYRRSTTM